MAEKLALKPTEAADAIGVSKTTMYELIASGQIPSLKVGADRRISVTALKAWIEGRSQAGSDTDGR